MRKKGDEFGGALQQMRNAKLMKLKTGPILVTSPDTAA
jgi:hypothetical protein